MAGLLSRVHYMLTPKRTPHMACSHLHRKIRAMLKPCNSQVTVCLQKTTGFEILSTFLLIQLHRWDHFLLADHKVKHIHPSPSKKRRQLNASCLLTHTPLLGCAPSQVTPPPQAYASAH